MSFGSRVRIRISLRQKKRTIYSDVNTTRYGNFIVLSKCYSKQNILYIVKRHMKGGIVVPEEKAVARKELDKHVSHG
jgi:hypothetical protein